MSALSGPPIASVAHVGALTLGGFITEVCDRFATNEALVFDDPLTGQTVRWTYADLAREATSIARAVTATGASKGAHVGVLMGNRPEAVAAFFGVALAGGVVVPLSTFSAPPELAFMLNHADIAVLLTQDRLLARDLAAEVAGLDRRDFPYLEAVAAVGTGSWDVFVGKGSGISDSDIAARAAAVSPAHDGLITYSSGTTHRPKGMLHNHRAPALQFWIQADVFGRDQQTRMWTALPMFWTAGINTAMGATLAAGGCWVMQETFEPGPALALMAREAVTEPYCLPHQTAALEEHPAWLETDLSAMRCVFGKSGFARHPRVTGDTSWNMPVGYGLSETCAFFIAHPHDRPRDIPRNSMGRLLPGNELRIVDPDTGRELGPNEDGEFAVRGPTLMQRYVKKTRDECLDQDGFFHTGDAGYFDDDGVVHWTGRRTEMIKTGGANVSPAELEVQLRACPPVKLARVLGVPDPRLDQLVVLCVTLKDGATATEQGIQNFLRERVASYQVPKRVLFFADGEIPMTGSATKVRDAALLALVTQRLNQGAST
ncbi:MAG: class I adenylate-forming enzyme family protein [Acidimicrobiales bacterium]